MYSYSIKYKKGSKLGNADALSRLPFPMENDIEKQNVNELAEKVPLDISNARMNCYVMFSKSWSRDGRIR